VSDRIFSESNPSVSQIVYTVENGQWLAMEHPRLQQLYAEHIRLLRAPSPFFIRLFFWLTVVAISCVFGAKSWQIAKQRKDKL